MLHDKSHMLSTKSAELTQNNSRNSNKGDPPLLFCLSFLLKKEKERGRDPGKLKPSQTNRQA